MPATRLRLCVVGAAGRMGSTIIREASSDRFEITGAIDAPGNPKLGMTLREAGLGDTSVLIQDASRLDDALRASDVCLSFTQPEAEVQNIGVVAASGMPIVMGTTGLNPSQKDRVETAIRGKISAVVESNFSIGANVLFALAASTKNLPRSFEVSVSEIHHSGKVDAPSGTALKIGEIIAKARGYTETVYGRSGISKRKAGELEISAIRGGGVPGVHTVFAFGPHEMLKLEHTAFSRSAFATGALLAAEWVSANHQPGVYSMLDVLGFPA
jgi:4-hydroxy-tetrahydrodipicolinate reductase